MSNFTRKAIIVYSIILIFILASPCSFAANSIEMESPTLVYPDDDEEKDLKNIDFQNKNLTKKQKKKLAKLLKKYNIDTVTHSIEYYDSLKVADPFKYVFDYMSKDRKAFSDLNVDSLSRTLFTDTLSVVGGMAKKFNTETSISNTIRLDSLITAKTLLDKKIQKVLGVNQDTLSLTATTAISLFVPGFAQIRNKDYWKLPVLYGVTGGFVGLSLMANTKVTTARRAYYGALGDESMTKLEIDDLHRTYNSKKNERLAYIAGGVVTYIYFIADGIYNFEGKAKAPAKASLLGLFVPGGGQIYNKSYWKLPIYYGGLAALGYVVSYNSNGYNRYDKAYQISIGGGDPAKDEFGGRYSSDQLKQQRDSFRRSRDLSILYTAGFYLLGVIEAYVDASFKSYDISDELAFKIVPTIQPMGGQTSSSSVFSNSMVGVSVDFSLNNK